jgi:hypothetical protein
VLSWDLKTPAEAIAAGRDTARLGVSLWSEKIMELHPIGTSNASVVWQWNAWDHLVQAFDPGKSNYGTVSQHPELIHLNQFSGPATSTDWLHCNSLDYDPVTDQIIVSCHNFSELWIIDHGTTTAEAAGHTGGRFGKGGDLLYRWGNPQTYGRGTATDKKFFGQHHPHRIPAGLTGGGDVLVFNNGLSRPAGNFSTVEILHLPSDTSGNFVPPGNGRYLPDSTYWKYTAPVPTDFFSQNISGAQRLANGNTLICSGQNGTFFEIDTAKNTVWKYICPTGNNGMPLSQGTSPSQNSVFRCTLYPVNYSGFNGHPLVPGDPLELNPSAYTCSMLTTGLEDETTPVAQRPVLMRLGDGSVLLEWQDAPARIICSLKDISGRTAGRDIEAEVNPSESVRINLGTLASGCYIFLVSDGIRQWSFRLVQ